MIEKIDGYQIAAWLQSPEPGANLVIRNDIDIPTPGTGEVLVKLECTGVWFVVMHAGALPMRQGIKMEC